MAARRSEKPISVISPQFCLPLTMHLTITKKLLTLTRGTFTVTDPIGENIFNIKTPFLSYTGRRVMYDAAGNPVVTICRKVLSAYTRWEVFRGDNTKEDDLIFSGKGLFFGWNRNVDVFLASSVGEEVRDFEMKAAWLANSCTICAAAAGRNSSSVVAQMQKRHAFRSPLDTKDDFLLTVSPNVDYAFIVALIVILDDIDSSATTAAAAGGFGSM